MLRIALTDPDEVQWLRGEFNTARDSEYEEILERLPTLPAEVAGERARGRATFAEVEKSETDLDRFRCWLAKIEKRDYFGVPLGGQARAAVAAAARELAKFEAEALQAHAPASGARLLRAVPGGRRWGDAGPKGNT